MKNRFFCLVLCAFFTLSACTKKEGTRSSSLSPAQGSAPSAETTTALSAQPNTSSEETMDLRLLGLSDEAVKKLALSPTTLLDAVIEQHVKAYNELKNEKVTVSEIKDLLEKISKQTKTTLSRLPIKASYEKAIEVESKKPLVFNKEATTLVHILLEGKMQSYSATVLHLVIDLMNSSYKQFISSGRVVLVQKNHFSAGLILKTNNKQVLVKVETLAKQGAYASLGDASKLSASLRIVDANAFLATEVLESKLLQEHLLENARDSILKQTAQLHSLPLAKLEEKIEKPLSPLELKKQPLDFSVFAFGLLALPTGDHALVPAAGHDELSHSLLRFVIPKTNPPVVSTKDRVLDHLVFEGSVYSSDIIESLKKQLLSKGLFQKGAKLKIRITDDAKSVYKIRSSIFLLDVEQFSRLLLVLNSAYAQEKQNQFKQLVIAADDKEEAVSLYSVGQLMLALFVEHPEKKNTYYRLDQFISILSKKN